jgi:integrase
VVRPSTYKAAEQYFAIHWKPLRNRPIHGEGKIERADIAARLQELTKAHGRTSAGRARDNLSALYGWAGGEMDDFGRIVRLLLLTGCRREEIAQLRRSEINMQTGVMIIDGSRTKNHQTLELTLPALALDILQSTPHRADREYFFGLGRAGFSGFSYSMMALRSRIADAEGNALAPWRLHDLRRTFRTGLGKLGVAPHVAELAIGHVKRGIEAVYDRHRYQREIKSALAIWADHVAAVVEVRTSNIVTLQQSA